ncbi:MAG: ATP-binding protein [Candidatus Marinimicrobia bacterium]|nr:ATP-binding protein [Candidatus Neomarinimicrobiota bacterium]
MTNNRKPIIGKFMLDSISIGMYNHPLMVMREYIQNSVDSIDEICNNRLIKRDEAKIEINIDGRNRSILIKDNGGGIPAEKVWDAIYNIGKSEKQPSVNRGFRGIGRLGGLGYCDELRFKTKAHGENIYTISIWDSKKLRQLINESNSSIDAVNIVKIITKFSQHKYYGSKSDHFFIVEMDNVKSSKDICLDVPEVKSYLSQVAPVPFEHTNFSFSKKIEEKLIKRVPSYGVYNIYVNGEKIFKPYNNIVRIGLKQKDKIQDIDFVEFKNDEGELAFGWIAKLQLLGSINSSNFFDGIRVLCGNILVGNKSLLSGFFREERFNNYLVGEIYITNGKLILNSRRDDFEDNKHKEGFYNSFVKEIGIPYSRKIREASEERSRKKIQKRQIGIIDEADKIIQYGFLAEDQKNTVISKLKNIKKDRKYMNDNERIDSLIKKVERAKHYLDRCKKRISKKGKVKLKEIFETIYELCNNKIEAEKIVNNIMKKEIL